MANELVIIELLGNKGDPVRYEVADGVGIEKGTLLVLTDPRTAIINSGSGDKLAGIAQREKVANTGRTRLAVHTRGIFRMTSGAAIAVGAPLMSSATANKVITATAV